MGIYVLALLEVNAKSFICPSVPKKVKKRLWNWKVLREGREGGEGEEKKKGW